MFDGKRKMEHRDDTDTRWSFKHRPKKQKRLCRGKVKGDRATRAILIKILKHNKPVERAKLSSYA